MFVFLIFKNIFLSVFRNYTFVHALYCCGINTNKVALVSICHESLQGKPRSFQPKKNPPKWGLSNWYAPLVLLALWAVLQLVFNSLLWRLIASCMCLDILAQTLVASTKRLILGLSTSLWPQTYVQIITWMV